MTTLEMFRAIEQMYKDMMDLLKQDQMKDCQYDAEGQLNYDSPLYASGYENKIPNSVDRFANPDNGKLIPQAGYGALGPVTIQITLGGK